MAKSLGGDMEGALKDVDRLVSDNPRDPFVYSVRATVRLDHKDYDACARDARRAVELGDVSGDLIGSECLMELGRYHDAVAMEDDATKILSADPSEASRMRIVKSDRAIALIGDQRPQDALPVLESLLLPDQGEGQILNAYQFDKAVDHLSPKGRTDLESALSARPASAVAHLIKGHMLEARDVRLAVAQYDEAIRLKPDWKYAHELRADAHIHVKDYAPAIIDLDWLADNDPKNPAVFMTRAQIYATMKDSAKEIENYSKAIDLAPTSATYRNDRCWARATANLELDAALEDCNEAVRLAPNQSAFYDSRGLVYLRLGRAASSVADYDAALALTPRAMSYFGRGLAKRRLGDQAGAQADFDAATKLSAGVADVYAGYGLTP